MLLYGGGMAYLLKTNPLSQLLSSKSSQHLLFGAAASVFGLWLFRTGIYPGLDVHFLWLTALSLLLGFRRAMLASALALLGVTAVGLEPWQMLGTNGLLAVTLPIGISYLVYNLAYHHLPRHFLTYVFLCAFITGALMISLKMAALAGYYYLEGVYSWQQVYDNYLILALLLAFPEGMLNGMTMTLLIIYKPHWIYSYSQKYEK